MPQRRPELHRIAVATVPPEHQELDTLLREYVQSRDLARRNQLVLRYEPLVRYLAGRVSPGPASSAEDLAQVGFIGLISALERFDPQRGLHFPTFAAPTILGHIKHYLNDLTWGIKAPRRLRALVLKVPKIRARLEQERGCTPTVPEMADAAGVSEERLVEAMELARAWRTLSIDGLLPSDGGTPPRSFRDGIGAPDPALAVLEQSEMLRQAMDHLRPLERSVLQQRFFREASQSEVARRLGVSQMHVSRLERAALRRLREVLFEE